MAQSAITVVEEFFTALERKDVAAVGNFYADDIAIWHNFSNAAQNKQENLAALEALTACVASLKYEIAERVDLGDRVLQRHILKCRTSNDHLFQIPACMLITVKDGKIHRIDEYLDSGQANALRAATNRPPVTPWSA